MTAPWDAFEAQELELSTLRSQVEQLRSEVEQLRHHCPREGVGTPLFQELRVAHSSHPNVFVFDHIERWLVLRPGVNITLRRGADRAEVLVERSHIDGAPYGSWATLCETTRYGHPLLAAFERSTRAFERAEETLHKEKR